MEKADSAAEAQWHPIYHPALRGKTGAPSFLRQGEEGAAVEFVEMIAREVVSLVGCHQ
jgi:hypothetical protein